MSNHTYDIGIVRFECGCIGIPLGSIGKALIIRDCRSDHNDGPEFYLAYSETMLKPDGNGGYVPKTFEPVSPEQQAEIVETIGHLMVDGFKFREIQRLLGQ